MATAPKAKATAEKAAEATPAEPFGIIELRIDNVKRIKAVCIRPDTGASVIEITGKNGQGKTSILDAIMYAIGGKDTHPLQPVRKGEASASVQVHMVVDTDEYFIEREWEAESGKTTLTIKSKEGAKFPSPQALLDKIAGDLTFDPLAFSRMDSKKQAQTIKALAKLDFTALDAKRKEAFENRTDTNRSVKALETQVKATPKVDAPAKELSIADLSKQLQEAISTNRDNAEAEQAVTYAEEVLEQTKGNLERAQLALNAAQADVDKATETLEAKKAAVETLTYIETEPIEQQIATAEDTNRLVRQNVERARLETQLKETQEYADELTKVIEEVDQEKQEQLAAAKLPIEGLGITEDGVTLDGIPFEQACSSTQLKVSVAMGLALNPKLKIMLVRDGSLLDSEGRTMLTDMAKEAGAQVWMERATDGEPVGVVIEDGEVKSIPVTAEA